MKLFLLLLIPSLAFGQAKIGTGNLGAGFGGAPVAAGGADWTANLVEELIATNISGFANGDKMTNWTATVGSNATNSGAHLYYETGIKNGHPIVRGIDLNDSAGWVATAPFGSALSQPFTVGAVFLYSNGLSSSSVLLGGYANPIRITLRSSGVFAVYAGGSDYVTLTTSDNNWHILLVEFSTPTIKYRIDGGTWTTINTDPGNSTLDGLTIGSYEGHPGLYWYGDIAGIFVWSGSLSSAVRDSWFADMNALWAVY